MDVAKEPWERESDNLHLVSVLALVLALLIAGVAGRRMGDDVGQPHWFILVAILGTCVVTTLVCLMLILRIYRHVLETIDAGSVQALKARRSWYQALNSAVAMVVFGLPLVLVRQAYWAFAPWAAFVSFVACIIVSLGLEIIIVRTNSRYYPILSPRELEQERSRYQDPVFGNSKFWSRLFVATQIGIILQFLFRSVSQWTSLGYEFPPQTAWEWFGVIGPVGILLFGSFNLLDRRLLRQRQRALQSTRS
jgi:uncharacterized membrane protein YhdT